MEVDVTAVPTDVAAQLREYLTDRPSPPAREASGQPLEAATRFLLEPRFQHNFGLVRAHSDAAADALTAGQKAQALAIGQDLYFCAEQYAPRTAAGLHSRRYKIRNFLIR